jgi:hypothetical protein
MPFADRLYLCLCGWSQAVVWLMRATSLVCECFVHGVERSAFIGRETAAAEAKARLDLCNGVASKEGKHRLAASIYFLLRWTRVARHLLSLLMGDQRHYTGIS